MVTERPTVDEYGADAHPAFAMVGASRVSAAPGAVLFDSDVRHGHFVRVTLRRATRRRDLNRDWLHATTELVEFDMSEAQWASFVSSMNVGSGVPCTLAWREGEGMVPSLPYEPRLAQSMAEVHEAADAAMVKIKAARDEYEAAVADKAPAKVRSELLRKLHYAIENATSGMDFAAKSLGEHAENVVQRARADIEAMVVEKAEQLGVEAADVSLTLAIGGAK